MIKRMKMKGVTVSRAKNGLLNLPTILFDYRGGLQVHSFSQSLRLCTSIRVWIGWEGDLRPSNMMGRDAVIGATVTE